ncbi:MAG: HEAT repeat domain-containing protein [Sandaracinaceae bacterium]|nr:HEAT repeat domain-containing protein [Sandaracinaceae bacterium]
MKTNNLLLATSFLAASAISAGASAQNVAVHDRARGELSLGTAAPTRQTMVDTIRNGSTTAVYTILEYGEHVECSECQPLLEAKLLESGDARVREISAWWLRRRPFGFGAVMHHMRTVLETDTNIVHRARAAEAIGEFMDAHGLPALATAAASDADATVRRAAVVAVARINAPSGNDVIASAFADDDVEVRRAAIDGVSRVNFFRAFDEMLPLLADSDASVRRLAARALGTHRVTDAVAPLAALLRSDSDPLVRQAAAWALGRIGGGEATAVLTDPALNESVSTVRDAITIARQMSSAAR